MFKKTYGKKFQVPQEKKKVSKISIDVIILMKNDTIKIMIFSITNYDFKIEIVTKEFCMQFKILNIYIYYNSTW